MKSYKFNNVSALNIESHSNIIVKEARTKGFIEVEVSGSDKNIDLIRVKETEGTLYIIDESESTNGDIVITSGNSVMNFNGGSISNISMSDGVICIGGNNSGKIKINGKTINLNDLKEDKDEDVIPTLITIYTSSVDLDLQLQFSGTFKSDVPLISSFISTRNRSRVSITSKDLEVNSSNSSLIEAKLLGGSLIVNSSNSSQVITTGTYSSIGVNSSNSSDVNTKGHCLGNYRASASNSSYICNEAKVDGRKTQNTSNSARIKLY